MLKCLPLFFRSIFYRPLPQRYPPISANGQQHRPWPDDQYDPARPNANQSWQSPAPRQLYDSPPKPANHVPLQLQVHNQERYLVKRGPEQTESRSAPGLGGPRGNDQPRINGGPRAERLTVDCGSTRGNPMVRKSKKCPLNGWIVFCVMLPVKSEKKVGNFLLGKMSTFTAFSRIQGKNLNFFTNIYM